MVVPAGAPQLARRVTALLDDPAVPLPALLRTTLGALLVELHALDAQLGDLDRQIGHLARTHPIAIRLQQIPGIGPLTATALVGSVPHIAAFRRGRHFASWLGLTPRETSSGRTRRLGGISKRGDRYLRTLLTHGARSVLRVADRHPTSRLHQWAHAVESRRGHNRAASALANKLARVVWAIWVRDQAYVPRQMT